jgi:hypothetical protein
VAINNIDNDDIDWQPSTRPAWPGDLKMRRDPGDIVSVDGGRRSKTTLWSSEVGAEFVCAHARTRVWLNWGHHHLRLSGRAWTKLVLYCASLGYTCACFRARWVRNDPRGKFCRSAAIQTWRWIEKRVPGGHQAFSVSWEVRESIGPEFRWDGEVVEDGLCYGIGVTPGAPRRPRWRRAQDTSSR